MLKKGARTSEKLTVLRLNEGCSLPDDDVGPYPSPNPGAFDFLSKSLLVLRHLSDVALSNYKSRTLPPF